MIGVKTIEGGMRRIVSFVWSDIRKIQTMGNRKKISTSVMSTPRSTLSKVDVWSMDQCAPWARSRSLSHCLMKTFDSA